MFVSGVVWNKPSLAVYLSCPSCLATYPTVNVALPAEVFYDGQVNVDNIRIDGNTVSSTSGSITLSPVAGQNLVLGATSGGIVTASEFHATLGEFTTNSGDNTYLRGILKKK